MTTKKNSNNDDFFDLVDILRVIWKWKFIILAGTVVFAVVVAVISINAKKVYRVEMTIRPGNLSISEQGNIIQIDSSVNISSMTVTFPLMNCRNRSYRIVVLSRTAPF